MLLLYPLLDLHLYVTLVYLLLSGSRAPCIREGCMWDTIQVISISISIAKMLMILYVPCDDAGRMTR